MKLTRIFLSLFLFLILSLGACSSLERPETNVEMLVVINDHSLSQTRWYIPSEETIRIEIINQTNETHTLSILEPSGVALSGAPWFSVQIAANESLSTTFSSPAAAGEYDIISDGTDTNNRQIAEIVVVQP
jgi:hypothetical protein